MFVSSPISASPMYERWGTFVRSPMREFLISTKVPAFGRSAEDGPGAKVTEGADQRVGADLGVDRDHVRADLGAAPTRVRRAGR